MPEKDQSEKQKENKQQLNNYLRYSAMAFQMGAIIALGAWLGSWLDERVENQTPWYTIGIGLFSIFAALYLTLKDLIKGK